MGGRTKTVDMKTEDTRFKERKIFYWQKKVAHFKEKKIKQLHHPKGRIRKLKNSLA